jgi:purine-binding chemotaxis protein CheW
MSGLHVVFKVGEAEYALPAADVLQMESYAGATVVPGARPFVAGIVQIRGKVVPVVDLRVRFGLPAIARTLDSRVVVGRHGERTVGLLVDSAREVVKVDDAEVAPPPDLLAGEAQGMVKAVARVGKRLLMVLDFPKLIGED